MTDKTKKILQKIQLRRLFRDPEVRDRILNDFNRDQMDDVGPVGGDQEIKVLKELNEMQDLEGDQR
jgi:flagellar basal body-associated protein FliL